MLSEAYDSNAQKPKHFFKNLYLKGNIGISIPANKFNHSEDSVYLEKKLDNRPVYNIGVGYKLNDMLRADLNFSYRDLKYSAANSDYNLTQSIKTYSFFINGYFDININKIVIPYFTAGIGYSHNNTSALVDSENDQQYLGDTKNNCAWNIGIGSRFVFSNSFNLDVAYRYVDLGKINTKDIAPDQKAGPQSIKSHEVTGGLIYFF